ncbi:hypothetical protein [Pollutibacter soli]|uniref:hypothetical protein n=1 Tax=Pollutibacter soli TaxID=3034157 RepID=UPI0030132B33
MREIVVILSLSLFSCSNSTQNSPITFPDVGYLFVKQPDPKDSSFPFYPTRHLESIRDSTYDAFYLTKLLDVFDEGNISLRGQEKPILRVIIQPSVASPIQIIRFTEGEVVVKKGNRVDYLKLNTKNLSPIEEQHFQIFNGGVPLSRRIRESNSVGKRFWDSIIKVYPQLMEDEYYEYIMDKAFDPLEGSFTYSTRSIPFKRKQFKEMVDSLNSSGYWQLPIALGCRNMPTDGDLFIVESNSGSRYGVVKFSTCNDKPTKLKKTIEKLLTYAGVSSNDYSL